MVTARNQGHTQVVRKLKDQLPPSQIAEQKTQSIQHETLRVTHKPCPFQNVPLFTAQSSPAPTSTAVAPNSPTMDVLWKLSVNSGVETWVRNFSWWRSACCGDQEVANLISSSSSGPCQFSTWPPT